MSNSSRPDPPPRKIDNCLAVFVGFTTINSLLYYWTLNKANNPFSLKKIRFSPPDGQPNSASVALATAKPTPTAPTPTSAVEFSDVPERSWASPFIKSLQQRNLVEGFSDRRFEPDKLATRAEFAVLLQKVFDKGNSSKVSQFKDLSADYWASDAINKVSQTGLLKGYPKQDFRPDQPVTRAEVLVALATALKLKIPSSPAKTLQVFQDSDQILDYAVPKVAAAKEAGLVAGYPKDKILVPNKPATRAEMAAMLSQALAISGKEQKVSTRLQPRIQRSGV